VIGQNGGRQRRVHILLAEQALGRPLPPDVLVHHFDEDRSNNTPSNLLICTRGYHQLLHARMRALAACGNPDWRKCVVCKQYDDLVNMRRPKPGAAPYHPACRSERRRELQAKKSLGKDLETVGVPL